MFSRKQNPGKSLLTHNSLEQRLQSKGNEIEERRRVKNVRKVSKNKVSSFYTRYGKSGMEKAKKAAAMTSVCQNIKPGHNRSLEGYYMEASHTSQESQSEFFNRKYINKNFPSVVSFESDP